MPAGKCCWISGWTIGLSLFVFRPLPADEKPKLPDAIHQSAMTGTPSCSARACHGGIEPAPPGDGQTVRHNEYPLWLARDPHAQAFDALFNERSQRIAKNLGIPLDRAHEDARCLACHASPFHATSGVVAEERMFGVGCEACHGAAADWLVPHQQKPWRQWSAAQKQAKGIVPLDEPLAAARTCAGCHVGEMGATRTTISSPPGIHGSTSSSAPISSTCPGTGSRRNGSRDTRPGSGPWARLSPPRSLCNYLLPAPMRVDTVPGPSSPNTTVSPVITICASPVAGRNGASPTASLEHRRGVRGTCPLSPRR